MYIVADEVDFRSRKFFKDKVSLYNDKRVNSTRIVDCVSKYMRQKLIDFREKQTNLLL